MTYRGQDNRTADSLAADRTGEDRRTADRRDRGQSFLSDLEDSFRPLSATDRARAVLSSQKQDEDRILSGRQRTAGHLSAWSYLRGQHRRTGQRTGQPVRTLSSRLSSLSAAALSSVLMICAVVLFTVL